MLLLANKPILCLEFCGADIEFRIVLMTLAYCQYLKDVRKQYLALIRS